MFSSYCGVGGCWRAPAGPARAMPATAVSRRLLRRCAVALLVLLALCSRIRAESRARLRYGPKKGVVFHKLPERFVLPGARDAHLCACSSYIVQVELLKQHRCFHMLFCCTPFEWLGLWGRTVFIALDRCTMPFPAPPRHHVIDVQHSLHVKHCAPQNYIPL